MNGMGTLQEPNFVEVETNSSSTEFLAGKDIVEYFHLLLFHLYAFLDNAVDCYWLSSVDDLKNLDELMHSYDRRATPTNHLDIPTTVMCELYLRSIGSINPATMDYQVDLYLRQRWVDERLIQLSLSEPLDLNDPKLVKRLWKPEVFFANAKEADFQYVTVPNVLVRINPNGEILYMLRLKLTFSCMMNLQKYPLDTQICHMEIGSFSKTTSELNLKWYDKIPVKLYENLTLPQFEISKTKTSNCQQSFQIGEYSCLKAEFHLTRNIGYHLVQNYLPTTLIVVISWVSFWLDVDAIPARITLGVTTLLTISSKGSSIQSNIPPVSYVKAVDVWTGACTTMVFCALLEFTLVNYLWRRKALNSSSSTETWVIMTSVSFYFYILE
ncbi:Glycine receptor subunit alpha-3 [Nymphon striatum]|nr:Glycine receptor subunit alpha-3 [Nymphon striatum]